MISASGGYFVLTPQINEIVIGMVVFGLVFLVLQRVLLPRLDRVYAERHDRIDGGFQRAEQARAESRRVLDEYHVRLGQAREEAGRIRDEAREEGQRHSDEVLGQVREESSQNVTQGREQLGEQQSQLRSQMQPDIARLSRELAGRILGRRIGDDEYRETVDAYLGQQRA